MNPQNGGDQIWMRHSSLWRQPLLFQKPVPESETCHKQLNELGMTGISWRTRDNFIKTNFSHLRNKSALTKSGLSKKMSSLIRQEDKQSNLTRSMMKSLAPDAQVLQRSKLLVDGMQKLKKMDLLTGKQLQKTKFPGVIRAAHVHNDYHTRQTNPGFSRNYQGKIYTR